MYTMVYIEDPSYTSPVGPVSNTSMIALQWQLKLKRLTWRLQNMGYTYTVILPLTYITVLHPDCYCFTVTYIFKCDSYVYQARVCQQEWKHQKHNILVIIQVY